MNRVMVVLITLWTVGFLALFAVPAVHTQQPMIIQLADGSGLLQTQRAATLANSVVSSTLTARNAAGVQLMVKPSSWVANSAPAANSQATASIAAEAAVRHVADCIGWSANASAAVAAAAGTLVIRDGATGAGTVLATFALAHQVAAGAGIQTVPPFLACGLNLVGTTNTAMTAEFNAGVTGESQAAFLTGYNLQ